jgi:hypothetical protein
MPINAQIVKDKMTPEDKEKVQQFVKEFGMSNVLISLIEQTDKLNIDNSAYLTKLVNNLKFALLQYEGR